MGMLSIYYTVVFICLNDEPFCMRWCLLHWHEFLTTMTNEICIMLVNHSACCSDLQIPGLYSVCVPKVLCESHYQLYKCTLLMYVRSQGA